MSPRRALGSHLSQPPGLLALLASCLNFSSFLVWGKNEEPWSLPREPQPMGWGEQHGQGEQGHPHQGLGHSKQSEGLPGGGGLCWVGRLGRLEYARRAFWGWG